MSQPLSFEDAEHTYDELVAAKGGLSATDLLAQLRDGRGVVRANALLGLAALGHPGREVLLYLRDADARVARAAAEALVRLGPVQRANLTAIAATLEEARPEVIDTVARMFASLIGKADGELISVLDTASPAAAGAMIAACARADLPGLKLLQTAARDPRTRVRLNAVRGLSVNGVREPESSFDVLRDVERIDDVSDVRAATRTALAVLKARCISVESARRKTTDPAPSLVPELEQRVMKAPELKAAAAIAPLDELVRLLDAPAVHARLNAARVIALKGAAGLETVNALVALLRDVDASVRLEVAQGLARLGAHATVAVPALVAALEDPDPAVVAAAEATIAGMGDAAARALVDGLDTPSELLGARVASLIGRLAEGPQLLRDALSFTSVDVCIHAAVGLAAVGKPRASVALSALAASSTSRNARLRAAVAKAIAAIEPRPDRAPPAIAISGFDTRPLTEAELTAEKATLAVVGVAGLAAHLNDPRLAVRTNVAVALGTLDAAAIDAAHALAVALRDGAGEVRIAAARSIDRLGDAAVGAVVDDLVGALRDDGLATQVAGMLRTRTSALVDAALVRGLDTTDGTQAHRLCELIAVRPTGPALLCDAFARPPSQANAARGLAMLGKERIGKGRALLEAARGDLSLQTRELAAATLRAIEGPRVGPATPAVAGFETTLLAGKAFGGSLTAGQLLPFLQDGRPIVRANAATALGTLGASGPDLSITLGALLRDDDPQVRIATAHALDALGDDAVIAAAPKLVDALRGDASVHAACKAVLAARGAKVEAALLAGLETEDETHGMRIAELVCALPDAPRLLFAAFDGPAQNVQINAALGIGLLGAKRAGAAGRQRLRTGLAGPVTRRSHAIVKALALLGPE